MSRERRNYSAQCDRIFGKIVRAPGRCIECGSTQQIQCAHGFSRSYRAVRWDERNAFPLCQACHVRFTHRPLEWDDWLRRRWGDDLYALLRARALSGERVDVKEKLGELRVRWREVEQMHEGAL